MSSDGGAAGEGPSSGGVNNSGGTGGTATSSGGSGGPNGSGTFGGAGDTGGSSGSGGGGSGGSADSGTIGGVGGTGGSSGSGGSGGSAGSGTIGGAVGGSSGSGGSSATCTGANGDQVCSPPQTCQMGECVLVCTSGQINCDDTCVDPLSNDTYCGASSSCTSQDRGDSCTSNESCEAGVCRLQCPGLQVPCDGTCIDPATDEAHCGASNYCEGRDTGDVCGSGEQCLTGLCRRPDGAACNVGVDCISGICSTFFLDIDGDGYGAESSGMQSVCGLQPPTADYVTNNLDCCDDATDLTLAAEANPDFGPNEFNQLGRSFGVPECAKPFDWDCDGSETTEFKGGGCSQHTTQALCDGTFTGASPACGVEANFAECLWTTDNECVAGPGGPLPQRCY